MPEAKLALAPTQSGVPKRKTWRITAGSSGAGASHLRRSDAPTRITVRTSARVPLAMTLDSPPQPRHARPTAVAT